MVKNGGPLFWNPPKSKNGVWPRKSSKCWWIFPWNRGFGSMALSKVEDFRDSSIKRKRFRCIQSLPNLKYPKTCWLSSGSRSKKKCLVSFLWVFNNIREMRLCVHITVITDHNGDTIPPNPGFAHTQTTHPNNMIYLSPEDE